MTLEEIKEKVAEIERLRYDNAKAHIMEDRLYTVFISYLSKQKSPYQEMAKEVIKADSINFRRWYE
ncbi:hypothetical protein ES708_26517 [subsurface metagenome]